MEDYVPEVYEILGGWSAYHPPVVFDTAHYALLVEGRQDELSDGNEDMLENENSLESLEQYMYIS